MGDPLPALEPAPAACPRAELDLAAGLVQWTGATCAAARRRRPGRSTPTAAIRRLLAKNPLAAVACTFEGNGVVRATARPLPRAGRATPTTSPPTLLEQADVVACVGYGPDRVRPDRVARAEDDVVRRPRRSRTVDRASGLAGRGWSATSAARSTLWRHLGQLAADEAETSPRVRSASRQQVRGSSLGGRPRAPARNLHDLVRSLVTSVTTRAMWGRTTESGRRYFFRFAPRRSI